MSKAATQGWCWASQVLAHALCLVLKRWETWACTSHPHSWIPQEWIQNIWARNTAPAWSISGYSMDHVPGHAVHHLFTCLAMLFTICCSTGKPSYTLRVVCAKLGQIRVLSTTNVWVWGRQHSTENQKAWVPNVWISLATEKWNLWFAMWHSWKLLII